MLLVPSRMGNCIWDGGLAGSEIICSHTDTGSLPGPGRGAQLREKCCLLKGHLGFPQLCWDPMQLLWWGVQVSEGWRQEQVHLPLGKLLQHRGQNSPCIWEAQLWVIFALWQTWMILEHCHRKRQHKYLLMTFQTNSIYWWGSISECAAYGHLREMQELI